MPKIFSLSTLDGDSSLHCSTNTTRSSAIAVIADRAACSILTLFIVIATSRPVNKKICSLSVRGSNNYCRSASADASAVRTPLLHLHHSRHSKLSVSLLTNEPCVFDSYAFVQPESIDTYGISHFVFLWCILWLNDTSYGKSVKRDEQEHACQEHAGPTFSPVQCTPILRATMHSITDRQTDGQMDNRMMPIADHTLKRCIHHTPQYISGVLLQLLAIVLLYVAQRSMMPGDHH